MPQPSDLFRSEALEELDRPRSQGGLLRIAPVWVMWAYWLLVFTCGAAGLYVLFGHVYEYASGPAIVRMEGRTDITAKLAGIVESVEVQPGQHVKAGQRLVSLYQAAEASELKRLQREFDLLLVRSLRDPADPAPRSTLIALRTQRELALSRLAERSINAPHDGIVRDIRTRVGQHVQPGETLFDLVGPKARFYLTAAIPGHHRPFLRPGMSLRLELEGYRYHYQDLVLESVGEEVVGPNEVRRFLPPEFADTLQVQGPVVLLQARFLFPTLRLDGHETNYYEGMQGRADVRLRLERIVTALVPGLRGLL